MAKEKINVIVDGGHASAGPPLGPKLGPLGLNVQKLILDINTATKSFEGIKVPVDIVIDKDSKTWTIEIGTPSASQLIFKEMKLPKGGGGISTKEVKPKAGAKKEAVKPGEAKTDAAKPEEKKEKPKEEPKAEEAPAAPKVVDKAAAIVGNASRDVIIKIAKLKMKDMGTRTLTGAVKTVIGTCLSSCIKVDGKDPREAQKEVDAGLWDEDIKKHK